MEFPTNLAVFSPVKSILYISWIKNILNIIIALVLYKFWMFTSLQQKYNSLYYQLFYIIYSFATEFLFLFMDIFVHYNLNYKLLNMETDT